MFKVNEKNVSFLTWSYSVLGYNGRLIPDKTLCDLKMCHDLKPKLKF